MRRLILSLLPLLLLSPVCPAAGVQVHGTRTAPLSAWPWWKSMQNAIMSIQRHGAGNYSTSDKAKQALVSTKGRLPVSFSRASEVAWAIRWP